MRLLIHFLADILFSLVLYLENITEDEASSVLSKEYLYLVSIMEAFRFLLIGDTPPYSYRGVEETNVLEPLLIFPFNLI